MGGQISKTAGKEEAAVEKAAEGAAVAAKTNGQVHLQLVFFEQCRCWIRLVRAVCGVNGVLHVPCSIPALTGVQGKWPHGSMFAGGSFVPIFRFNQQKNKKNLKLLK